MNTLTLPNQSATFADIFKSSFLESFSTFNIMDCLIAFVAAFLIGLLIFFVYKKTFAGVLYSNSFNSSLIMMTMITTLIILGVTSNIVLSLGMVGALSIVRFRTAIKDPVDIVFLFWAIAEGILCGAGLLYLAIVGAIIVALLLMLFASKKVAASPFLVIIRCDDEVAPEQVTEIMKKHFKRMKLKSKTIDETGTEIIYEVRVSHNDSAFLDELKAVENVTSAVLVSYDGNFNA